MKIESSKQAYITFDGFFLFAFFPFPHVFVATKILFRCRLPNMFALYYLRHGFFHDIIKDLH